MQKLFTVKFGLILVGLFALAILALSSHTIDAASSNLTITKDANKTIIETDSGDKLVTYSLTVKNNLKCDVPVDNMLVFDRSGSMDDDGQNPPQPITNAKNAAGAFIDALNFTKDQAGLVSYSSNAKLDITLVKDGSKFKAALATVTADGFTNIQEAIQLARNELKSVRANKAAKPVIILFSDGVANRPEPDVNAPALAIAQAQQAKAEGVTVIAIGLGKGVNTATMQAIASPNQYYYAPDTNKMTEIYKNLAQSFQGVSPDTQIIDNLNGLLDDADFVSASDGGQLVDKQVIWNIGDIPCGGSKTVTVTLKVKDNPATPGIDTNNAQVSNSVGDQSTSNDVNIDIRTPDFTISVTDHTDIAKIGDKLTYEVTVQNIGTGIARDVLICNKIPDFVSQIDSTISDKGTVGGQNIACWRVDLAPGETRTFYVSGTVIANIPDGYSTMVDSATLTNEDIQKQATDETQVFTASIPVANYELFATCVKVDGDNYTAYFGYNNKLNTKQQLDVSETNPAAAAPKVLLVGRQDKIFNVTNSTNLPIAWTTKVGDVTKSVEAKSSDPACETLTIPTDPLPVYTEPQKFLGGSHVFSSPVAGNLPPAVNLNDVKEVGSCSSRRVTVGQCQFADSDGTIAAAQYSLDKGGTWYPIDDIKGLGTKNASCSFLTPALADGNYELQVRAADNNQNIGVSATTTLNINCQGIVIESTQFNQETRLSPLSFSGTVQSYVGTDQYIAIAVAGGPQTVDIVTKKDDKKTTFQLTYNRKLELWEGNLKFVEPGLFELQVIATEKDGAQTTRSTNSVQAERKGRILDTNAKEINDAEITLYYRPNLTTKWQLWNGVAFNHQNLVRGKDYAFTVEPGWYYIEVTHPDYYTSTTKQFYVGEYSILANDIELYAKGNLGNWLNSVTNQVAVVPVLKDLTKDLQGLIGKPLPDFSIQHDQELVTAEQIRKAHKPALLVTWTDWGTLSAAQWQNISDLVAGEHNDFNIYPLGLLEGKEEDQAIVKRGDYKFPIYKPVNYNLFDKLFVISAPQYYFIDDKGDVRDIKVGTYKPEEIKQLWQQVLAQEPANSDQKP